MRWLAVDIAASRCDNSLTMRFEPFETMSGVMTFHHSGSWFHDKAYIVIYKCEILLKTNRVPHFVGLASQETQSHGAHEDVSYIP